MHEDGCVGFLVVRLPDNPIDTVTECRHRGIPYCGLDRSPWWDIENDYYSGQLPKPLCCGFETIQRQCQDFSGVAVSRDYELARQFMLYSNTKGKRNEVIAIHSTILEKAKGTTSTDVRINWLGFDAFALGEWSLIKEGLFAKPKLFPGWEKRINAHGLLANEYATQQLTEHYEHLCCRGLVEDLSPVSVIDRILVGRIVA